MHEAWQREQDGSTHVQGGKRTRPGDSFSWRSCIFQCPFRPFLLGKCCTGPPQGPQRDSSGGRGHCCPTWPTQLHRSCEQAGMTCYRLLEQNNLRSSCGRPESSDRVGWSETSHHLPPYWDHWEGKPGAHQAPGKQCREAPPAWHKSLSVGKTNK